MARFRFRLATLQKLREIHRDELRGKLAQAYEAQQVLETRLEQLVGEIDVIQQLRRKAAATGETDVNHLLETQRYQLALRGQQATLDSQVKLLAEETERRRQAVVEADRGVRSLKKLEQKQRTEHQAAADRKDNKYFDEVAQRGSSGGEPWA